MSETLREKIKSIYWDINKCLSYDALFNVIIGNRGAGKTFGATVYVIKRFLKNGDQFFYVRRYKKELKKNAMFFNAIIAENMFPDHTFEVKNDEYYIDGKLAGYSMCVSTAKIGKGVTYPKVKTIIYDEFIIEKGVYHYLPDEVVCFLNLYESIARTRDVRVFLLSNAVTMTNPYCLFWDLKIPRGKNNIYKNGEILLELVQNVEFIEMKKKTRFGQLVAGTKFADYSIDNKFLLDNDAFIEKKGENPSYSFTLSYKGYKFGIWYSYAVGKYWVSYDIDPSCKLVYSLTLDDHRPNTMLIKNLNKAVFVKNFLDNYKMSNVYFESVQIKNLMYEILRLILC